MSGGILNIATSKIDDLFPNNDNIDITFFKNKFKKYSNFSFDFKTITPDQSANYNSEVSFQLTNEENIISRIYANVTVPEIAIDDTSISSEEYHEYKKEEIQRLNKNVRINLNNYNTLKSLVDILMPLYRDIYYQLTIDNSTIEELKTIILTFENKNRSVLSRLISMVDENIFAKINFYSYIISLNHQDNTLTNTLDKYYTNMIFYLNYYYNRFNRYQTDISNLSKIYVDTVDNLGHYIITDFTFESSGQNTYTYSNDLLEIISSHKIKDYNKENYYKRMIDNDNNNDKNKINEKNIQIPLHFWFCKDSNLSLPLLALRDNKSVIKLKINSIFNIFTFLNYKQIYENLLNPVVMIINNDNIHEVIYKDLIIDSYDINLEENIIQYHCKILNIRSLMLGFDGVLLEKEISDILENYGEFNQMYSEYTIDEYQWIHFMTLLKKDRIGYKVGKYLPFIDFDIYYNKLPDLNINLICEYFYLTNNERNLFATSNLNYSIEVYEENNFNFKNKIILDSELSFTGLCKSLYWVIKINNRFYNEDMFDTKLIEKHSFYIGEHKLNLTDGNVLSYKHLNSIILNGVYYYTFCLFPEKLQPSGVINFNKIKNKHYTITVNNDFINEYKRKMYVEDFIVDIKIMSVNYDILSIHKGQLNIIHN
jgi:hypothetical protein